MANENVEYPQIYKNDEGVELIARNEVQASAFEAGGFKAAGPYEEKAKK